MPGLVTRLAALVGTLLFVVFILGLALSISQGFAGFWGGLPFWFIAVSVLAMALYYLWEEMFRSR